MKTNILTVAVLAIGLSFSACTSKLSTELLSEISTFQSDWTSASSEISAFGSKLDSEIARLDEDHAKMHASMPEGFDPNAVPALKEHIDACEGAVTQIKGMKTPYSEITADLDAQSAAFSEWNEKVTRGEVKEEDAKAKIEEFKGMLAEYKSKLGEWETTMTTALQTDATAHAGVQEAMAMMPAMKK